MAGAVDLCELVILDSLMVFYKYTELFLLSTDPVSPLRMFILQELWQVAEKFLPLQYSIKRRVFFLTQNYWCQDGSLGFLEGVSAWLAAPAAGFVAPDKLHSALLAPI